MHIVFINPPSPFLVNDRGAPPLGILHLAAELDKLGMVVSLWDMTGDPALGMALADDDQDALMLPRTLLHHAVASYAEQDMPVNLFAITATSAQYDTAKQILAVIRADYPKIPVAIGGSHVSALPKLAIDDGFDLVVTGEADIDFPQHLVHYGTKSLRRRPFILNCKAPTNLDELQLPLRELVDLPSYCANLTVGEGLSTTIHMSRGCPYECLYCVRMLGDKARLLRVRSVASIWNELISLRDTYDISRFVATDDIWGVKRWWVEEFCEVMQGAGFQFRVNCRANTLHTDLLPAMKRAGIDVISFGFESGDERVLTAISKNSVEKNEAAIKACHDAGIAVKAYLIFGFAEDDEASAEATMRFIERARPDSAQIAWLVPLPGTPIYQQAIEGGWLPDYRSLYHNGIGHRGGMSRLPWHTERTPEIYEQMVRWVEDFYAAKQPEIQCPLSLG